MGYPILPEMLRRNSDPGADDHNRDLLTIRHYSLYTPRDFDISPYFDVVKPSVEHGFSYRSTAQDPRADFTRKDVAKPRRRWRSRKAEAQDAATTQA